MDTDLRPIVSALAKLGDGELQALIDVTNEVPQIAPSLLTWLEATCDLELNHRAGREYWLPPPEVAIPPEEGAVSIDAALAMRAVFASENRAPEVLALFDALVAVLNGAGRKQ